ncbi:tripartite motif-containing protein 10-like [Ornithorhynchus anatinus]|uniref:tripartite motif-containing protein 10-like n=1 Tax=Ornithorhynchus anatinus TaxID=9258 RepID=UPI0010A808E2|nr:tripartite motif-containing protein 10-like [Ornithorhynchus anatinus]
MASDLLESLDEEVTCPVCLGYLNDPVTVDCGHVFCRACATGVCERRGPRSGPGPVCPLCQVRIRRENFRPAWQVASLVRNIQRGRQRLASVASATAGEGPGPLHFRCEDDGQLLCVVCRESREHRSHEVTVIEEAAQTYRKGILHQVQLIKKEREEIVSSRSAREKKIRAMLDLTEAERRKVVSEFEQMRRFLEERERLLLARLDGLDGEIRNRWAEFVATVSVEIAQLEALVDQLEKKGLQEETERRLQDVKENVSRFQRERPRDLDSVSLAAGQKISDFSRKTLSLQKILREFQGKLLQELESDPESITLDADTANGRLEVSADGKRVTRVERARPVSDLAKRFDYRPCVLAREGFSAGRHRWEVTLELAARGSGAVGVAREAVERKGEFTIAPQQGIWALDFSSPSVSPHPPPSSSSSSSSSSSFSSSSASLAQCVSHQRVGVSLDYERGWITFSNPDTRSPICTFSASFSGKIFPFFGLWGSGSRLTVS